MRNEKAYVHLKWAESLDGKTIVLEGDSWITGKESRDYVHYLRAQSQAVLIGRGTLEKDDPSLNVRKVDYEKLLKVIIFDPDLRSFKNIENKNIYKIREPKNIIYLCKESPRDTKGLSFLELKKSKGLEEWDLEQLTKDLYKEFGIQSVFVEGGAKTISALIEQTVFNRISKFTAPHKIGKNGEGEIKERLCEAIIFEDKKGNDKLQEMYFKR
jgi:diaminohydroxyphosphoribosylaminopyrimidine deaminase/5-amino-6-(5-phosphoribosylamino)uracil reductase